ncbi:hypothetical protein BSLA_02r2378 [Burkholderia stabilis]|nr:hypothetical protein BSLA_02r2378 [Burkholderia stabilis]
MRFGHVREYTQDFFMAANVDPAMRHLSFANGDDVILLYGCPAIRR